MSAVADDLEHIAITGMAGRFPGAPDVDTFWRNLVRCRESVSALTDEELLESGVGPAELSDPGYVRAKGVLEDGDRFDAGFFGYSPREAELMDPQHRIFLECAWEALESAGCDPSAFGGRIGVFAGASLNSYLLLNVMGNRRVLESTGAYRTLLAGDKDFLATRVAYKFDLRGPAVTVQTACSTSLMAVHLACQSLLNGECDIALAGGVSLSVPLKSGYVHEQGGIMSAEGRCRPFDAGADGTVAGNGVGIVVLRRLADALEAGDAVDAVIRGTAVNNDGALKVGYTAPSVEGQAEVVAEALAVAGVEPSTIEYVEAHGTGTALGDPIEIAALTRAHREHTRETGYCAIGSVKANVGHLDAAAGVTALIKATLALKREAIPAMPGFTRPHPELALESTPFYVNTELRPWPRRGRGSPRRAAVSSFGIGGTNVHAVLEEAPAAPPASHGGPAAPVRLLPLSARSPQALAEGAHRLADHLEAHPDTDLGDVAHTLTFRRRAFEQRRALVCRDRQDAIEALRRVRPPDAVAAQERAPVAFLFPGQGTQYAGMARDLYAHHPVFAAEVDRCAELFGKHLGEDLRPLLFAGHEEAEAAGRRLERTEITQPALFTVEYALARLWQSSGLRPKAMAGHSIGEYVAACLAGVFSLEDAVRLVAVRGRLVQRMPRGAMLSVFLPEAEVEGLLGDDGRLCVAAVNSTGLCVVSGSEEEVAQLQHRLTSRGIGCRRLRTSHAFHSPDMAGAVEPFTAEVATVRLHAPAIPFCSNVTGTWITAEQATRPEYWGTQLRATVRFSDALDLLLDDPGTVLLEVGPGRTLSSFARSHRAWHDGRTALGSLRHPDERRDDREYLADTLGGLWSAGVPVDRGALCADDGRRALRLPGYAFQRQRYWVEPDGTGGAGERTPGTPGEVRAAASVDDWFYTPGWKRLPRLSSAGRARDEERSTVWAVLGTDLELGRALARRLADGGRTVVRVAAGSGLDHDGEDSWTIDPTNREHCADLLKSLNAPEVGALRLVHLWSTRTEPAHALDADRLDQARRWGFDSLLALAQGIGDTRPTAPVTIDVLCRGVHSVTGQERLQPENATLLGACTVIPQELPGVGCRTLDLTGTDPRSPGETALRELPAVLDRPVTDRDLALRGRHWWVRDVDTAPLGAGNGGGPRLRDGGVYLVTGGLGGIGLALAEELARGARRPVIGLLGRSEFPAEETWDRWLDGHDEQDPTSSRIRRLRRLRELGAEVVVLRADVTDEEQTARAVARLRNSFGPLRGVIHAAGLPSRGMIAGKSRQDVDEVLAAKTVGTLVLDRVCREDDLDFLLLCSSLTSLLGGPGQSDYCAANAFLDAFAQWHGQRTGSPVCAVAWDTWNGVGMASGLGARLGTAVPEGEETGHPLLRRLVGRNGRQRTYLTTLTTENWILDDHRIMGHGLVPGTTYLELVRAAVAEQAGDRVVELNDVLFTTPVIVPDGRSYDVYTTIEPDGERMRFTVRSRSGAPGTDQVWQEHASGTVTFHERGPDTVRDLAELRERTGVTEVIDTEEEIRRRFGIDTIERGGPLQFAFGPRWRCLRTVEAGDRRLMVTLRLDDEFLADLEDHELHPALLDVAGASARLHAQDVFYLPFTYRSLRIEAPLTGTVHCYVELKGSADSSETLTCDTEIHAPDGRLLVRITGFTIKRINDLKALRRQVERAAGTTSGATRERTPAGPLSLLAEGMSETAAREAFTRIMNAPVLPEQLAVSRHDLPAKIRLARSLTPELLAGELERMAPPPGGTHPRPALATPYAAPRTDLEREVASVWQEVLGIDRVGVHDDFFALGGHSLAAVQIGAKIQSRFGRELELRDFFETPTVAHTATLLTADRDTGGGREEAIPVLSRDEPDDVPEIPGGPDGPARLDELSDEEVEAKLLELLAADTGEERETE